MSSLSESEVLQLDLLSFIPTHLMLLDLVSCQLACKTFNAAVKRACALDRKTWLRVQMLKRLHIQELPESLPLTDKALEKYISSLQSCLEDAELSSLPYSMSATEIVARHAFIMHGTDFDERWAKITVVPRIAAFVSRVRSTLPNITEYTSDARLYRTISGYLAGHALEEHMSRKDVLASTRTLLAGAANFEFPELHVACFVLWRSYAYDSDGTERDCARVMNGEFKSRLPTSVLRCLCNEISRWLSIIDSVCQDAGGR